MTREPAIEARAHVFVAPALSGPESGGTLYNTQLISALRARGMQCRQIELGALGTAAAFAARERVWVDSLYLGALPELAARSDSRAPWLVVHYLPSLAARGRPCTWQELSAIERDALELASGFLVTSPFMAQQLARYPLGARALLCVEPGVDLPPVVARSERDGVHCLLLCNVVEAKGVLPCLQALAQLVREDDRFTLAIAGSLEAEPSYARACAQVVAEHAGLSKRVEWLGALRHRAALARLQQCDVLLSASRMESYGMALAEARAAGVAIVAREGGNAAALVTAASGGTLVACERDVAAQFLALVRDPAALAAARARARAMRLSRSWRDAAADFAAQLAALG